MSLSRIEFVRSTTKYPWTRDFRHLLPVPKQWTTKLAFNGGSRINPVPLKDRIKYWNVVPGDQVRIRGEGPRIREVLSVNKFTNRVYLKGNIRESNPNKLPVNRSVHYSRCQLFLGNQDVADKQGALKSMPVFAQRVGVRDPHWHPLLRRFDWKRIAVATVPGYYNDQVEKPIVIPWPKYEEPPDREANPILDTNADAVAKITYQPPAVYAETGVLAQPADEDAYIRTLFNPSPIPFDESQPMEFHLTKELSNPHSRAKKQARWQADKAHKAELLKKFVQQELTNLKGRSARVARAEGAFKFRQWMEEQRKAEKKRRWLTPARLATMAKKAHRKRKKAEKERKRLNELVLPGAANQVVPADARAHGKRK
ncbi:hypothetical protein F5I97DRAFT_1864925 [Phlebopus sp. FC_14]|nr:hypothetical protein F5I97DRAFT_1864925 [Phlebopus sp. FC_14]